MILDKAQELELIYEIEEASNAAAAFKGLLLAATEAAFNGSYNTKDYEEVFYYLCDMAYKQSQGLEELKEKAFKLLQEGKE